jgi:hypothetical protein
MTGLGSLRELAACSATVIGLTVGAAGAVVPSEIQRFSVVLPPELVVQVIENHPPGVVTPAGGPT